MLACRGAAAPQRLTAHPGFDAGAGEDAGGAHGRQSCVDPETPRTGHLCGVIAAQLPTQRLVEASPAGWDLQWMVSMRLITTTIHSVANQAG